MTPTQARRAIRDAGLSDGRRGLDPRDAASCDAAWSMAVVDLAEWVSALGSTRRGDAAERRCREVWLRGVRAGAGDLRRRADGVPRNELVAVHLRLPVDLLARWDACPGSTREARLGWLLDGAHSR